MADKLTPARRSANMAKIRSRGTAPEMTVRRVLHAAGYRYRLHGKGLPGKPDIVFSGRKKVIFVHGCFWHQHDDAACADGRRPKSNTGYWDAKLTRNVERDREHVGRLTASGWEVLVIWECELGDDAEISRDCEIFWGRFSRAALAGLRLQSILEMIPGSDQHPGRTTSS